MKYSCKESRCKIVVKKKKILIRWLILVLCLKVKLADPAECALSAILLCTLTRGLESSDRFVALRCLETLGRLAQRDENEVILLESIDTQVIYWCAWSPS